jgi:voltage-gated potassium channel
MDTKKVIFSFCMLMGIISLGTGGYFAIEGMSFFDAFYMTIISISTVGFAEIKPLTPAGRTLTVIIIILGISFGTYTVSVIVRVFIEGELQKYFGRRKVQRQIINLKNHFIICGFGRIGRIICDELAEDQIDFIVIEKDPIAVERAVSSNYLFLEMDATSEEALLKAGIHEAKGLVTAVNSDANNVFITLTARGLRPDIFILARASEEINEDKLCRAGASQVTSPYLIGGKRMGQILKRPTVVDFIDIAMMGNKFGLMMEEARVNQGSPLIDKNLISSNLRNDFGVIIVAIKKKCGDMIFNPLPLEKIEEGDVMVVIGKKEDLIRMSHIL